MKLSEARKNTDPGEDLPERKFYGIMNEKQKNAIELILRRSPWRGSIELKGWLGGVRSSGSEEVESGLTKIETNAVLSSGFIVSSHSAK